MEAGRRILRKRGIDHVTAMRAMENA